MKLVNQILVKKNSPYYAECDRICFLSKNLYNQALYRVNNQYENDKTFLGYHQLTGELNKENQVDFRAMQSSVSQQSLMMLEKNFKSFFTALNEYKKNPEKFKGEPNPPMFKHKTKGRFVAIFTVLAISKKELRNGYIKLAGVNFKIKTDHTNINQVRTSSKATIKLTVKRNNKIKDYMHKASREVVKHLQQSDISKVVVGQNKEWKQSINLRKSTNQNFVAIPHARFISMCSYKNKLLGIEQIEREESYTSKCSFLDNETIRKHNEYKGKRIKRGLFRSANGTKWNADCNGAANILKKEVPNAFVNGIEGILVSPRVIKFF